MKKILILSLLFGLSAPMQESVAQQGSDRIRTAMVSLYTDKMELTPAQAKQFWPIHNQYQAEKRSLNRQIRSLKESGSSSALSKIEALESRRLQLKGKYKSSFLNVISSSQLAKMYSAEEEFKKMLIHRMNED